MFILDTLLIGSLRFVLDKVVAAAEAEMQDDTALREQLLEAQMRLELGEISDQEFGEIERDVLTLTLDEGSGWLAEEGPVLPRRWSSALAAAEFASPADVGPGQCLTFFRRYPPCEPPLDP